MIGVTLNGLACPGVFYPTQSGDGVLSRIRTPGGLLTARQAALVADIADRFADGMVTITNRANLQLRALADRLPDDVLLRLQEDGLASRQPAVDHLRNIMASPTAGLDAAALVDTRPFVHALDRHLAAHPHLAALPAKFSVGFDGGERASIAGLPNDILFRAYRDASGAARFRVWVRSGPDDGAWDDGGIAVAPDQVVPVAAAIADMYVSLLPPDGSKPRLRHLLAAYDNRTVRQRLLARVPSLVVSDETFPAVTSAGMGAPIGVHAQIGDGLTFVGLAPTIAGRLPSARVRRLAALADRYGSGNLRLTPWRSVVIPDVPHESVESLQDALEEAGLSGRAPSLASGIVACAGSAGCASGATDTVRDAQALSALLGNTAARSEPLNVHLSGCEKCCAQRRPADITLLGRPDDGGRYDLFVRGDGDARLGRLLFDALAPDAALAMVARLVAESEARD